MQHRYPPNVKCNLIRLISYTRDPSVGWEVWMRCWRTNTQLIRLPKPSIQIVALYPPSCFLCLVAPFTAPSPRKVCLLLLLFKCTVRLHLCGCVWETAHALPRMCDFTMHPSVWVCVCVWLCVWFLALLQAHWKLSSHQDVPTGPSLGRVPGLSPACVLAECCQIIPHTWKAAWRWSYPPFTLNLPLPSPTLPKAPTLHSLLDRLSQRSPQILPA